MCVPGNAEKMHVRAEWLFLENSATLVKTTAKHLRTIFESLESVSEAF